MQVVTSAAAVEAAVWSVGGLRCLDRLHVLPSEIRYAFVDLDGEATEHDDAVLDGQERARSRRFIHADDRRRFVVSHASMRVLLARCLGVPPDAVRYDRESNGKPRLVPGMGPLQFSLSHSGSVGLLAVTRHRQVGVDVEHVRDMPEALTIAEQHFAPAETEALRSMAPASRRAAFLRCWTHKEAVIKATGEGLGRALDSFELELTPSTAALRQFDGVPAGRSGWSLADLPAPRGHLAAGAFAGAPGEPPPRWRPLLPVVAEQRAASHGWSKVVR